jgi:hypothetical protein
VLILMMVAVAGEGANLISLSGGRDLIIRTRRFRASG